MHSLSVLHGLHDFRAPKGDAAISEAMKGLFHTSASMPTPNLSKGPVQFWHRSTAGGRKTQQLSGKWNM